jgi:hypothetical protein
LGLNPDASVNDTVRLFVPGVGVFKIGAAPVYYGSPESVSEYNIPAIFDDFN